MARVLALLKTMCCLIHNQHSQELVDLLAKFKFYKQRSKKCAKVRRTRNSNMVKLAMTMTRCSKLMTILNTINQVKK